MRNLFVFSAAILLAAASFTGCSQDATSPNGLDPMAAKGKPSANPAWVFGAGSQIVVSDVDGSNGTPVYTSSIGSNRSLMATWSPTGGSASFIDMPGLIATGWYSGSVYGNYAIKAVDVSVSNGKVVSSNTRTIYSVTTADQKKILSQAWCPATTGPGAGKIAFLIYTPTESRIYLIPVTGGTPTLIYSTINTDYVIGGNSITWNSDGTKFAFDQWHGTDGVNADRTMSIKIFDLTTNTISLTLLDGWKTAGELQWSNAGLDKISFEGSPTSAVATETNKYIVDMSGTTTLLVSGDYGGYGMYWSPDNTQLAYTSSKDNKAYRYNLSTGVSTLVGSTIFYTGDWK